MEISVKRMLRTRGALVAAVTALAVGLTLVVGQVLAGLIALLDLGIGPSWFIGFADPGPSLLLADPVLRTVLTAVPFTIGYFLSLWAIAPITEQLGVGHVITRAVLATGIGATVLFVTVGIAGSALALSGAGPNVGVVPAQLGFALQQALTAVIVLLPLGVLGGVLQWVWRTAHPAEHHIEGLIDV